MRKMIDAYKPDWCEVRENWSVYLFSPENRWVGPGMRSGWTGGWMGLGGRDFHRARRGCGGGRRPHLRGPPCPCGRVAVGRGADEWGFLGRSCSLGCPCPGHQAGQILKLTVLEGA